ncbi:hypothetical protein J5N97_027115 [Dioscorea zingiberensis]|uniref:Uncharacterized protein n=1 Tax=Dioscorea zingiberensis TaxID=325984 RepID=A0A9D5C3F4_9LILI|nr:hypothetical protein J5N97_027115 [Dioscorea zingiberensis]
MGLRGCANGAKAPDRMAMFFALKLIAEEEVFVRNLLLCRTCEVKQIVMPEDVYVKKFFKKHPDSLYHDAVKISSFDPPPARVFAWRVLELREHGVSEEEAMALADVYFTLAREKATSKPCTESAIKEIQAEEKNMFADRFFNPKILEIVQQMKEEKAARMRDRGDAGGSRGNTGGFGGGRPGGRGS